MPMEILLIRMEFFYHLSMNNRLLGMFNGSTWLKLMYSEELHSKALSI